MGVLADAVSPSYGAAGGMDSEACIDDYMDRSYLTHIRLYSSETYTFNIWPIHWNSGLSVRAASITYSE